MRAEVLQCGSKLLQLSRRAEKKRQFIDLEGSPDELPRRQGRFRTLWQMRAMSQDY